MKKIVILLLVMLLLLTGCGKTKPGAKSEIDYRECRYIGIIFDDPEQSKEFWLAINDSGNVLDAACSGWIVEFDPEACQGHYLKVFSNLYEQFNGEACPSIFFGFAGMSPEMEEGFRTECKKFIGKLRPELPFEARVEDSDRVYQKFVDYSAENIARRDIARCDMEAGTEEEFLKALTGAEAIVLKNDLTVDISDIRISDVTVNQIDCKGHALILLGTCAADDHYHTIEVNNASSIDISKLDVDVSGLSAVNEEMEPSIVDLFRFNISYKNIALGDLPERKDASENPIVVQCYADINDEGTAITVTVRRAQSVEARRRQETEYLWKYFENPGAYHDGDRDLRMRIYTDVELYLDDFDTPGDQDIMVEIEETGSLKLSGKINIMGPPVRIGSVAKGSVDIRELTINRECMSPDCMSIQCEEGVDEQLTTPKEGLHHGRKGKLMVSISEVGSAITVW